MQWCISLVLLVVFTGLCSAAAHHDHEHSMHSSINTTDKVLEDSSSLPEINEQRPSLKEQSHHHSEAETDEVHQHGNQVKSTHESHTDMSMTHDHGKDLSTKHEHGEDMPINHAHLEDMSMSHKHHGDMAMMHDQSASSHEHSNMDQSHDHTKVQHMEHMDDHMHMNMNGSGMHMKMWFHTGIDEVVLFEQWKIKSDGAMIGSMIGIVLLAMFYEGLKFFREYLFKQYLSSMQFSTVAVTGESGRVTQMHKVQTNKILSLGHAVQTGLHMVQIVMSYFLMLIFMTYNVWLCLSVVLGAGIGYFIFGWKKATVVDITEHCH